MLRSRPLKNVEAEIFWDDYHMIPVTTRQIRLISTELLLTDHVTGYCFW